MKYKSVLMTHVDGGMHHLGVKKEDICENVILVPDPMMVSYYAKYMDDAVLKGDYREYVTYSGKYKGKDLTIMSCGFGCMPMAIAIEELNHIGGKNIIRINENCAIQEEGKVGDIFVASASVRSEGASREYIDIAYPAVSDMELLGKILEVNPNIKVGLFRSHDVENLDSPYGPNGLERIRKWHDLGIDIFDGETSSMFIVAACLKLKTASLALVKENYLTQQKIDKQLLETKRKEMFDSAAKALLGL